MSENKVQSVGSKLFAMANQLRGLMDAADFKNYILAFMFYRYLSEHQEEYLVRQNILTPIDGKTTNEQYAEETKVDSDLIEYLTDISASLGYAISPEYTWESLIWKIDNSEIVPSYYFDLFESFNKNAQINQSAEKDFTDVFQNISLSDTRLGNTTNERTKSMNAIVKLIDEFEYKAEDGRDILGEVYEYLIGEFAANAGKKAGEFYTPHKVSQILAKLVTLGKDASKEVFSVYDPTMGSGSLLLTIRNEIPGGDNVGAIKFFGQEKNGTTYNLARMNLMMHGVSFNNMTLSNADTLEVDWPDGPDERGVDHPRMFDAVVANPPYSYTWDNNESKLKDPRFSDYGKLAPKSKADFAFVLHSLYHLNDTGTMAIVLPHGVLFRGAAEGHIRKIIVDKNYLDAVIGLPANLFYGTGIPTIILVFKKNRTTKDILFIDASNDFVKAKNQNILADEHIEKIVQTYENRVDVDKYAHVASLEEIQSNEYNLNIPRYVDTFEAEEEIDLEEIQRLLAKDEEEIKALEAEINEQLKLLGIKI